MKFILTVFMMALLIFTGCSSQSSRINPDYEAYVAAASQQKPLLKLEITDDGRIKSIEMNQPVSIQQRQPDAPHPAWGVLAGAIRAAGIVGGIWAGGEALQGVVEASRGVTNYTAGGSIAGGDVSIPTTTTTTTETVTETHIDESSTFTEQARR